LSASEDCSSNNKNKYCRQYARRRAQAEQRVPSATLSASGRKADTCRSVSPLLTGRLHSRAAEADKPSRRSEGATGGARKPRKPCLYCSFSTNGHERQFPFYALRYTFRLLLALRSYASGNNFYIFELFRPYSVYNIPASLRQVQPYDFSDRLYDIQVFSFYVFDNDASYVRPLFACFFFAKPCHIKRRFRRAFSCKSLKTNIRKTGKCLRNGFSVNENHLQFLVHRIFCIAFS
jgi:hypothetical protein